MADPIDDTIAALHDAGANDDEITAIIKEKFGKPEPQPGIISRTASGIWRNAKNANPVAIASGVANAVMHPVDTYNGLVDQSAENFTEAKKQFDAGDYGHAVHHGIAAVIPPYNVVTHAGDEIRKGNIAGGVGEGIGAGLTAGLMSKAPAVIAKTPAAASATLNAANRAAVAGANFVEANPAVATVAGAGIGYMHGGLVGMLEGAGGGGLVPRLLKAARKLAPAEETAPLNIALGQRPAPVMGSRPLGPSDAMRSTRMPYGPEPGPSAPVASASPITDEARLLTSGSRPMPASADTSYVRAEPATYPDVDPAMQNLANRPASAPTTSDLPFTPSKVDIARITAMDKELGSVQAARALRHDPRFASMTPEARVAAVRSISAEAPNTLPAAAAAKIDAKFAEINPLMRAQYVESWKTANPAVYRYLLSKLK